MSIYVPYHDSNDNFHVRMHDLATLTHLLKFSGFDVIDSIERPGLPFKGSLNYINAFAAVVVQLFFKRNIYPHLVKVYGELEYFFGKKFSKTRSVLKAAGKINYGGAIYAESRNVSNDYVKVNQELFSHKR